jgi:hypothetical protein
VENVIRAFTLESVERLTGVTQRQLKYWDDTDFFKPEYGYENRRIPYSRLYSFQDVVALHVLPVFCEGFTRLKWYLTGPAASAHLQPRSRIHAFL